MFTNNTHVVVHNFDKMQRDTETTEIYTVDQEFSPGVVANFDAIKV